MGAAAEGTHRQALCVCDAEAGDKVEQRGKAGSGAATRGGGSMGFAPIGPGGGTVLVQVVTKHANSEAGSSFSTDGWKGGREGGRQERGEG